MTIYCNDTLVCENLRYMRKKRKMSRLALSRKVGIPACLIKLLEDAKVPPMIDYAPFHRVCEALDVSMEDMLHTRLAGDS